MRVFLDGRLIDEQGTTLNEAIDAARQHAGRRMIVQISADGSPVPASHIDLPPETSPYAQQLDFLSADPILLLRETMHDAIDAVERVKELQARSSEQLQRGELSEAIGTISELLDTWLGIRDAMAYFVRAKGRSGNDSGDPADEAIVEGLSAGLSSVRQALANQDWAGLGDALGWDMQERADDCRAWLLRAASSK